jgi:hypothetical protein
MTLVKIHIREKVHVNKTHLKYKCKRETLTSAQRDMVTKALEYDLKTGPILRIKSETF